MQRHSWIACTGLLAWVLITPHAQAQDSAGGADVQRERPARTLGFTQLLFVDAKGGEPQGIGPEVRQELLRHLRSRGVASVGGADPLFGRDLAVPPDLALGGVVEDFTCVRFAGYDNCRIAVDWQVLATETATVIYRVKTRVAAYKLDPNAKKVLYSLVLSALDSLVARQRFQVLFTPPEDLAPEPKFTSATLRSCKAGKLAMPGSASQATRATALVASGARGGSAFFINEEGYLLTAAHVVSTPAVAVRTPQGEVLHAGVVRINRKADTALLRIQGPFTSHCLVLAHTAPELGADAYAIGAPVSADLAFSLTRGIVSGKRLYRGRSLLQTDVAINHGNSGGPLLDRDGQVTGVVTLKLVRSDIEGIAFALATADALSALGLTLGSLTSPELALFTSDVSDPGAQPVTDDPDPVPLLDPSALIPRTVVPNTGGADSNAADPPEEYWSNGAARPSTPASPPARDSGSKGGQSSLAAARVLLWGGLGVAAAGLIMAVATNSDYDRESKTFEEYETLRAWNDAGWILMGVGTLGIGTSYLVPVPETSASAPGTLTGLSLRLGASF